jgi:hypothetical protein
MLNGHIIPRQRVQALIEGGRITKDVNVSMDNQIEGREMAQQWCCGLSGDNEQARIHLQR